LYAGLRAFGNASAFTTVPERKSTFSNSSYVIVAMTHTFYYVLKSYSKKYIPVIGFDYEKFNHIISYRFRRQCGRHGHIIYLSPLLL
jgi:hypothetical protein